MDKKSLELGMEEIMYDKFMEVTKYKLKPEVASYFAKNISLTIDYDNTYLMHQAPTSRAINFAKKFKDECFIDGINPLR